MIKWLLIFFIFIGFNVKAGTCTGSFVNPITDICWSCMFPISIGNIQLGESEGNPDTQNPSMPVQICQIGNFIRIGAAIGFWEPSYLVDVTRHPYCMVNLGGFELPFGNLPNGSANKGASKNQGAFYNVHWYQYPIVSWVNIIFDAGCMQGGDFDIGYFSELDVSWSDDEIAAILAPESAIFSNIIAQGACSFDAMKTMFSSGEDELFWCTGSHGSIYPLTGNLSHEYSPFQASLLAGEKMAFKMHRQGLILNTIGQNKAVCYAYYSPILPKTRWRYQMVNDITRADRCDAVGRTPMRWDSGLNTPTTQKNYGYLFWRKRNCVYL